MGRYADFEPKWNESTKRWCISTPGRLSKTGKRQRKYFKVKTDAADYGAGLKETEKDNSKLIKKIDPQLMADAVRFHETFQLYGYTGLVDACEAFIARLDKENKSVSFGELLTSYEQEHRANWGSRYLQGWQSTCKFLEKEKPSPLPVLDKGYWRDWMKSEQESRGWSDRSYNDFLSKLSSIWKYAVDNDFIEKSPIDGIARRKIKSKAVSVLTVEQTRELLATAWNHDRELVPYFAIGVFAGLRPDSELLRLNWEDVNFEEKWIRVGFGNKTDTKRFVPIEDNLLEWISPWKKEQGSIIPTNLVKRRRYVVRGKYQMPEGTPEKDWLPLASWSQRDIMRHSYGSYLDAKYKDRNLVKESMGHSNFKTYDQHYRRAIAPVEAEKFWSLKPEL